VRSNIFLNVLKALAVMEWFFPRSLARAKSIELIEVNCSDGIAFA